MTPGPKPLTEQGIITMREQQVLLLEEVQSAKRLLKQKVYGLYIHGDLMRNLIKMIDACFQIDDGKEAKE